MKKLMLVALLSSMLLSSVFSVTVLERYLYPEYKESLVGVSYKVIDKSDDVMLIEVNGVTYIYKLK